jgi:GT2 family glycosyltransferase
MNGARLTDTGAVIVTHARADLARACAERVLETIDPRLLVVVVNDPGNAGEPELEWLDANVGCLMCNRSPRGYGANVNQGVSRLRDRCGYYVVLNDDVQPEHGTIAALRAAFEDDPAVAVVAPRLVDAEGLPQQVAYRFPSLVSELVSALILPARVQRPLWRRFIEGTGDSNTWFVGAALLIRGEAFDDVSGFDERFFLYSEETDLLYRLRARGWSARQCDDAVAVHLGAGSTADGNCRRLIGVSRSKFIRKHWPRRERVVLAALLPLAYAWNSLYVLARIVVAPRSFRAKLSLWAAHWESRTAPRSRRLEGAVDA